MRKGILAVFVFLLIFNPDTIFAKEYSLTELWRLALERSETIKIAEEALFISEREKDKAKSVFLPRLSTFGNYRRYSREKYRGLFILQPEYHTSWGIRLDQSLSLGGEEIIAFNIAKENIIKSRFALDSIKEDYLLKVASAYYDVLKAEKSVEIAEANVKRLRKHRDAAEIRLKVGEVTKTALLRAEAELSGAHSELIKAKNNLRLAKTILAKTVGINEDYDVREEFETWNSFNETSVINGCQLSDLDCFKKKALSERSEIKALNIEKNIAKSEVSRAKGAYWPTLSIEGVYFRQEDHPSVSFAIRETMYAGLKLDFPLFEGGLTRAEVSEAKARLRQAELALLELRKSIDIEVENAYLELITESSILKKLKAQVTYATENYNMVSKQFEYGLANSIDVIDANTLLVTTERELADARFDYQLAILKLKRAMGVLLKTVTGQHSKLEPSNP
jgi:outer membrane protein